MDDSSNLRLKFKRLNLLQKDRRIMICPNAWDYPQARVDGLVVDDNKIGSSYWSTFTSGNLFQWTLRQ
ncbi:hypothetical protein M0802_015865 [Mischocyttarus mexicanus]|nr:hypothetical protein M0802_015865 [Mischocyttarus mexicanus]